MPRTESATLLHSSFYRFHPVADPAAAAERVRGLAQGLRGPIVLAAEGISGAVAGVPADVTAFEAALQASGLFGPRPLVFKHSPCRTPPFGRLKVSVKPEIVALGLPQAQALPAPDEHDDSHLSPQAWRELLASGKAVLLDNRNHFEWRLGRFRGAVDPGVHHFRDFVAYVEAHAPAWREARRPVAMYCTGGVRCDKTAPWMRSLGLQVFQLDGGIMNFFHALQNEEGAAERDWEGECFVFDNRIALDARLQETDTAAEAVFDPAHPDEAWRLNRAQRLDEA
ncbi:rhodanese-like domain-containing protein [Inhella sp.]|uniref:oxygen-dependent tRNA uridine(34) hydroxylase TrhO n=1 Tax=Inhella sp. TaxID=1921806 RepID=UPI0035B070BE